jgi:hypothetical protein
VLKYGRDGLAAPGIAKVLMEEHGINCGRHGVLDAQKRYVRKMKSDGADIETIVATTGVKQRLVEYWTRGISVL